MSTGLVRTEIEDRVLTITIDRPEVRNAVDGPTAEALYAAFQELDNSDAVDVGILTGASGTFCAGADLKSVAGGAGPRVHDDMSLPGPLGPTRMMTSKPLIAAVEGFAVAGGLELALLCDLRVAASDAVFGVFCRRWGVPLVDGGTIRLPRLIGHSHAMDMILTGRGVSGDEAKMMGLANRICEPGAALTEAQNLARRLAGFPQGCLRSDRESAYAQWDLNLDAALENETRLGLQVIRSGETRDGATRFAQGEGRHGAF